MKKSFLSPTISINIFSTQNHQILEKIGSQMEYFFQKEIQHLAFNP